MWWSQGFPQYHNFKKCSKYCSRVKEHHILKNHYEFLYPILVCLCFWSMCILWFGCLLSIVGIVFYLTAATDWGIMDYYDDFCIITLEIWQYEGSFSPIKMAYLLIATSTVVCITCSYGEVFIRASLVSLIT